MSKKKASSRSASSDEEPSDPELQELGFKDKDLELLLKNNIDAQLLLHIKEAELEKIGVSLGGLAVFRKHKSSQVDYHDDANEEVSDSPVTRPLNVTIPSFRGGKSNSVGSPTEFIQRFELAMDINGVKKTNWINMLLFQMNDFNDLQWLRHESENITEWDELRLKFITHFEKPNHAILKAELISKIKQATSESVQQYGDRFQNLQREAGLEDSIHMVEFFRRGLRDRWMILELKRRDSFENPIITVQRMINEALFIEAMFRKEDGVKIDSVSTLKKKYWCKMHGYNNSHTEENCKRIPTSKKRDIVGQGSGGNNDNNNFSSSNVKCYKCDKFGHYANVCTESKVKQSKIKKLNGVVTGSVSGGVTRIECDDDIDEYRCIVNINNKPLAGIIDTGANVTFISKKYVDQNGIDWQEKSGSVKLADGSTILSSGLTTQLNLRIGDAATITQLNVLDMPDDLLVGRDLFKLSGMTICNIPFKSCEANKNEKESINKQLIDERSEELKMKLSVEIKVNQQVFGFCELEEAEVTLPTPPNKFAYRRQYPIAHVWHDRIDEQIRKWLSQGVIKKAPPGCKFNSPLLAIAKKSDGVIDNTKIRLCVDYRGLNDLLEDDKYPLPSFSEIFDRLRGKRYITVVDCDQSYHTIRVAKHDQHKTAFVWKGENYVFQGAPFGIKTITSVFQRTMHRIMKDCDFVCNYVDDVIIFSDNFDDHIDHVKQTLNLLTINKFKINLAKCKFAMSELHILGHRISGDGIHIDERKLADIKNLKPPTSGKQVEQQLGLFNYFRRFIPNYATIAAPLEQLRKKGDLSDHWNETHLKAWKALQESLFTARMLHHPDFDNKFYVETDASEVGIGAALFQLSQEGERSFRKYITFSARALSISEKNYSATKKELLAIIFALKKFNYYLKGRRFHLYTDHKPLIQLRTMQPSSALLNNWIETIMEFDFDLSHVCGKDNVLPDHLSRLFPEIKNIELIENDTEEPHVEDQIDLINKFHLEGHFGVNEVYAKLKRDGHAWPNMKQHIRKELLKCDECQKFTIEKHGFNPYHSIESLQPFDHIAIDLAGPYPSTSDNYRFVLVVIDICTRYVILRPLQDKGSKTIANELFDIFCHYSFPRIVQSDNGTEFVNSVFSSLCKLAHIDHRLITPYHPRANGSAERSVRTMISVMRKQLQGELTSWKENLPITQYFMNIKMRDDTKSTPFSLMYCRNHNQLQRYTDEQIKEPNYEQLRKRLQHMQKLVIPTIAAKRSQKNQQIAKKFNKSHKIIDLSPGSKVMYTDQNRTSKLEPIYLGPCTIHKKTKGGAYQLLDTDGELMERQFAPSQLKLIETEIESDSSEIESILGHRGEPRNREYFVLFKDENDPQWIKYQDFDDNSIINQYWSKHFGEPSNLNATYTEKQSSVGGDVEIDKLKQNINNEKRARKVPQSLKDYHLF